MKDFSNKENSIDKLISKHMKDGQEHLSSDFNNRLMSRIEELDKQSELIIAFNTNSWLLPITLLIALCLVTFVYFMAGEEGTFFSGLNLNFNNELLQSNGVKYMLYSITALFVFSILDRFVQLRMNSASK